uniref:Uncharacterized protein n=1 Tax=Romanomermis culicivorax TaxID=13658 RepID=A0A915IHM3_ROMCU
MIWKEKQASQNWERRKHYIGGLFEAKNEPIFGAGDFILAGAIRDVRNWGLPPEYTMYPLFPMINDGAMRRERHFHRRNQNLILILGIKIYTISVDGRSLSLLLTSKNFHWFR